ncbi:MAG: alpha/beta fold hydrolase [Candidatus Neomarinimicrobiota bacterium]
MLRYLRFALVLSTFLIAGQQYAELGDFSLENGETIRDCRIGYRTYGQLNQEKSNVILFPTWFGGTSEHLGNLVGPDKLIDSTRYFVIAIDALGDGVSSSPSNSQFQPGEQFPLFTIRDMVNSQYRALTEVLDIRHLHCIVGGSMGGMQTFQWLVSYPDFMDKAVPYVGAPWQTAYGRLVWEMELLAIEIGRKYDLPLAVTTEQVALIQVVNAYTPDYRNRMTKSNEVTEFRNDYSTRFARNFRIDDWAAQLRAMMSHDITAALDSSKALAAEVIAADLLIIVSRQDHLVNPGPALELARMLGAETLIFDNDCGHLAPGCEMQRFVAVVHEFIDR